MRRTQTTLLAIVLLAALAHPATADPCVDYRQYLRRLGNLPTGGSARDLALTGDVGVLADGPAGLAVLDLADPAHPRILAAVPEVGDAVAVAVQAGRAYVASDAAELHVVDLADPAAPVPVAVLPLPDAGSDLHPRGPHLLVAAGEAGLVIVDIADLVIVASLDTPHRARGVDAAGDLAAVADDAGGLALVDVADPSQPRLRGRLDTPGDAHDVAFATPDLAVVAAWTAGVVVADVSSPTAPKLVASLPLPVVARGVACREGLAFLAGGGLAVVDLADPHAPRLVGRAGATGGSLAVALDGAFALVPVGAGGVDVFDVDPPRSPPPLSTTATGGAAFGLDTAGPLTVVGADDLAVFDHTDPTAPVLLGELAFDGTTSRLAVANQRAHLTTANAGGGRLLVIDLDDPAAPAELGSLQLAGFPGAVLPHGDVVYLADFFFGGLFVVDASEPDAPVLVATVPTRLYAQQLASRGHHILVATGAFGEAVLQVFDVSDPLAPQLAGEAPFDAAGINDLVLRDDLALVTLENAAGDDLVILDAADPVAPVPLGGLSLPGSLRAVAIAGDLAYVTTYGGLMHVVDLTDPAHPVRVGETFLPDSAFVLAPGDGVVHAAATDAGLVLLPMHCDAVVAAPGGTPPAAAPGLRAHPNPFNPRVTLSFTLARPAAVTLAVYDLAGRRLATLARDALPAGPHQRTWDGRDHRGRALPSGLYLARLHGDGAPRTARLVLVR